MRSEVVNLINAWHAGLADGRDNTQMYVRGRAVCWITEYRNAIKEMSNHAGHGRFVEYTHGDKTMLSNESAGTKSKVNGFKSGDECMYAGKSAVVIGEHPKEPLFLVIDVYGEGLQNVFASNVELSQTELDIEKEKQRKSVVQDIHTALFDINDDIANQLAEMLQERGHLAEIVLPLESDDDKA